MKLKVLVDNNTFIDQYYFGEPAVSYYIEDDDTHLLLDVGYSDIFLKNAVALGVNIETVDKIIISHGHDDHTRGLKYFFQKERKDVSIIAHPYAFKEKIFENEKICSPILEDKLKRKCNLSLSKDPMKVSNHLTFLGEIPQINHFEMRQPIGQIKIGETFVEDDLMDDSALVYESKDGIYIITGCSHSGICNIIEYAKKVCKNNNVLGVIGGFHLFEVTERVTETINYFKDNNIKELYPCHCTSFEVKAEIHRVFPIKEVGVGLEINW